MPISPNPKIRPDDDFELIQAINAGQSELFPELVRRYEGKLYNFGMRMCRDVQDAEDMVQDTFINVFKYLKDFRYETKFKNWLYRIATSTCLKKKRKSKYAPERELSLDEFIPDENAEIPVQVPGWASIPLDQLLNEELSAVIKEGVASLPEKYRLVLVLRDMEGFSTAEAAQVLGLTTENIKVRLHRARLFLREKLKTYYDHGT
ncbi:MAG: RNA polymerase sigma factor [Deltaproteobacteria bacterium]|nr:RNA polymerase sigma factor [Deltaproteobacteria bacterium]